MCKRASFEVQKGVFYIAKGRRLKSRRKEIDKNTPQKIRPPQAPPKEGMCLAGYGMLGVGEIEELRFRA